MATLVLGAAGAAIGGSLWGGAVLGVGGAVIGKAVGATLGSVIDQKLLGSGSSVVEVGRRDQLRVMGAREGAAVARVWGQMRLGGQLIWSGDFIERSETTSSGGKGSGPKTKSYSYAVSIAVAICEGEITRLGRVWADGQVLDLSGVNWRLYKGDDVQLADPLIAASVEGGEAPAYRGTAYVVFEELDLTPFGNRIPQFNFEVFRQAVPVEPEAAVLPLIRSVDLGLSAGDYGMATEPVSVGLGKGLATFVNLIGGQTQAEAQPDPLQALDMLEAELPACGRVGVNAVWFGSDLRADQCAVRPMVEGAGDGNEQPWSVSGLTRSGADILADVGGVPLYPGTAADAAVLQFLADAGARGLEVSFAPRLRLDQLSGNGLADPWGGAEQAALADPSRITVHPAPGQAGTIDGTAAARSAVEAFFGSAAVEDFSTGSGAVVYGGPAEWSYRRMVLHYAHLCALGGGVESFVIGWDLHGLVAVRDQTGARPGVEALIALAADVRAVLGAGCKIGYVAGWRTYGAQVVGSDVAYPLDALWADAEVDFVGIDYAVPLSDWRQGRDHLDADWGAVSNPSYLEANVEGGEGYDWVYPAQVARDAQARQPITDPDQNDPWVFRPKDLRNWWARPHWERTGGVPDALTTAWVPEMKPLRLYNIGCAAADLGSNQAEAVLDPLAGAYGLPHYSNGGQDVWLQRQYLGAILRHWGEAANNPLSSVYGGPMIAAEDMMARGWDLRPWPALEGARDRWRDSGAYALGHWLIGRTHLNALGDVVREVCARCGEAAPDVSALEGVLRGYLIGDRETARQSLQPLALAHGFDILEAGGAIAMRSRGPGVLEQLHPLDFAAIDGAPTYELSHTPDGEIADRVQVEYLDLGRDYDVSVTQRPLADSEGRHVQKSSLPVTLTAGEAERVARVWVEELETGRDRISFALPRSCLLPGPGDVVELDLSGDIVPFRIDRVEETLTRRVEAVRIPRPVEAAGVVPHVTPVPVAADAARPHVEFMDLPLLTGGESPFAPWLAATMTPWPGSVAVYGAPEESGYAHQLTLGSNAVMGETETALAAGTPGLWSRDGVHVRLAQGALESRSEIDVLNGANVAALRAPGTGEWEVIQFRDAELIGAGLYRLSGLLRGQVGTEHVIPSSWPAGTDFVLLDGAVAQVPATLSELGLERNYLVGPAAKAFTAPSYVSFAATAGGVGLRPYAPVHLRAVRQAGGEVVVTWVRRTRIGGDAWHLPDVPLGETAEVYRVQVESGATVLREEDVGGPSFTWDTAMQAVDGAPDPVTFAVAQVSDGYGPGIYTRITYHG